MRHQKSGRKLSRNIKQRKALFKNLVQSLILKEEIKTTEAKAKAVKSLVDKLIFKSRNGSLHVRRQIMAFLPDKKAANKLIDDTAKRFTDQVGGFTRMIRLGKRRGDNAMMVKMELVKKGQKTVKKSREKSKKIHSVKQKPAKNIFKKGLKTKK